MWIIIAEFLVDMDGYGYGGGGGDSSSIAGTARSAVQNWDVRGNEVECVDPPLRRNQGIGIGC